MMPGQAMPDGGGGGEPPLRVFPPRIEYASFETGTVYSTVVTIKVTAWGACVACIVI